MGDSDQSRQSALSQGAGPALKPVSYVLAAAALLGLPVVGFCSWYAHPAEWPLMTLGYLAGAMAVMLSWAVMLQVIGANWQQLTAGYAVGVFLRLVSAVAVVMVDRVVDPSEHRLLIGLAVAYGLLLIVEVPALAWVQREIVTEVSE